jgi:fumarate hydratase class II
MDSPVLQRRRGHSVGGRRRRIEGSTMKHLHRQTFTFKSADPLLVAWCGAQDAAPMETAAVMSDCIACLRVAADFGVMSFDWPEHATLEEVSLACNVQGHTIMPGTTTCTHCGAELREPAP